MIAECDIKSKDFSVALPLMISKIEIVSDELMGNEGQDVRPLRHSPGDHKRP
jgi:hypothetical protein